MQSFLAASISGAVFLFVGLLSPVIAAQNYSVTLYTGRVTSGELVRPFRTDIKFVDAYIFVGALAWTAKRFMSEALSVELEGQIGKYAGDQENWEMNLSVAGRWKRFPWKEKVNTSLAWGIGPSYATEVPRVEMALSGSSKQWLIYGFGEITLGPPKSSWAGVLRLHHRSPGFGLLGTTGGSNTLALGLKYFFERSSGMGKIGPKEKRIKLGLCCGDNRNTMIEDHHFGRTPMGRILFFP